MNAYGILILAVLLGAYALEVTARLLDLRALRAELPPEFRGLHDPAEYQRSQAYTRERAGLRLVESTAALSALLLFWFLGGFRWLDQSVRGLGLSEVPSGLVFIGSLALASGVLGLPFRVWSTFSIEERFGFNRTTPRIFAADTAKALVLSLVLGAPILALVLFFFERAGGAAWLWCWGTAAAFALVVQVVYPTWILPWWNRFEPLPEGELRTAILRYAERVGFPLAGVYVIDGSRRSTRSNAFFTGLGRRRRIALFDTLIERHPVPELVAVLAHEVGHYKRGHVPKMTALSVLHLGALFYLLSFFLAEPKLYRAFFVEQPSVAAGFVFFGLLYTPIELVLSVAINAVSRRHEYQADRFAAETTGDPRSMIRALERLAIDNLSNLTPHPMVVALEASHPPVVRRIRALEAAAGAS
ncbi:MAG TPA: M48 family metallopeptidase [Thermoanaerobaculia bacterium]|nr:M48 family metallopeptidase [Thermoanaerobaculia bacterium]